MNRKPCRGAAMLVLALATAPAWAAGAAKPSDAQREYQQERARCLSGESSQPRDTCLKEAAAAYAEARRGSLGAPSESELARNATLRCEAQPPADRELCIQRVQNPSKTEGSVGGGGVLRSTVTTEIR